MNNKGKPIAYIGTYILLLCLLFSCEGTNLTVQEHPILALSLVISVILIITGIELSSLNN